MALKSEKKFLRQIRRYKRKSPSGKTVYVSDYWQRYEKPRGHWSNVAIDPPKEKSKTEWLKDRAGHFVGRANREGETTARRFVIARLDKTRNIRERDPYGRIKGRAPQ